MMEKPVYLPFYMTYPVRYPYNQENRAARDIEYLREMYPAEAKRLLGRIAEILDRMDYEESMIYDEYPDKLQLRLMCRRVYNKMMASEEMEEDTRIQEMVELLVYQELWKRRCMYRRKYNRKYW